MGILLALSTYAVSGIFLVLLCGRLLTLWKAARTIRGYVPFPPLTPHLVLKAAGDILLLDARQWEEELGRLMHGEKR